MVELVLRDPRAELAQIHRELVALGVATLEPTDSARSTGTCTPCIDRQPSSSLALVALARRWSD